MTGWDELIALDCSFLLQKINRKPEVDAEYLQCRQKPGWREQAVQKFQDQLGQREYLLTINNFPYHLNDGIEHMLLWFHEDHDMSEVKSIACRELNTDATNVVVCCNAPNLKTIPEIVHYHVFVRKN